MSYNEARKAIELLLNRPKFEKMIGLILPIATKSSNSICHRMNTSTSSG